MFSPAKSSIQSKLKWIIMAASTVALALASAGFVAYGLITLRQEMARHLQTIVEIIALVTLASAGLTYLLSSWLQRIITRPISELAQTAKTVTAERNYSARARKHEDDELGLLVDSFNEMLAQVQQRDAALQDANDRLEKRVSERTKDLQLEITERKRTQARLEEACRDLRQTQQAVMQQERLRALGQMASGIAHDINNALSPVVGFADLLARSETGLSDTGKKYLNYIKTAGEDIAHIVARLREFYRRRDEREALLPLSLNQVAGQVIAMTRPRWRDIPQERGLTVDVQTDLDPAVPALTGIESEVREAITNLILNAVDALPYGGKIMVRTRAVRWNLTSPGSAPSHVVLEISDTGIGMDAETRKRCLEPFFSTKGKRGTGLGLAMVYGVMERHEGIIEIESQLGSGTTMRLVFPVREAAGASEGAGDPGASVASLQILCIDDEPLLRELLRETLERDGHRVEVSDGGQNGLAAFRAARERGAPFDIVITDLGMPYLDGRQVAKTVKRESPQTPIVLLTGWGAFMKEDGEALSLVDVVLSKPPRSRELREALSRLAAKQ